MTTLALILTAAAQTHPQTTPSNGVGAGLLAGAILVVAILLGATFWVMARRSRASRGGVRHPAGDGRRGSPPFEGIERRHFPADEADHARKRPSERPGARSAP